MQAKILYKKAKIENINIFYAKKVDNGAQIVYNNQVAMRNAYGGIAQLARALGSYPGCHRFKSSYRYHISHSEKSARWSRG